MDMLTISELRKSFGTKQVLKGLNLSVPANSVFGFVGKNGAGKTTTMKAVLGLLRPDSGEITVNGQRVTFGNTATNRSIGYLPDVPEFYTFMTPLEYLRLCGESLSMSHREIASESGALLELVGLSQDSKRHIKGFSRGMKQRLGIAQALLGNPKLLICDEPTSALDPIGRKEILDVLLAARERTTVLFSTHILSDVERICSDVAVLHDGRIAMQSSVSQLKMQGFGQEFSVELSTAEQCRILLEHFPSHAKQTARDTVCFRGGEDLMQQVMSCMVNNQIIPHRMERMEASLENLFLEVTSK